MKPAIPLVSKNIFSIFLFFIPLIILRTIAVKFRKTPKAIVKSGGVKAGQKELDNNKRSRSAKLRTALKI